MLGKDFDIVARSAGGANAGHTVVGLIIFYILK
jgi:adenylosuccinate synthase